MGNQCAQVAVTAQIAGERDEGEGRRIAIAALHIELRADDQWQAAFAGCNMGAHNAGERAFIRQRQCSIALAVRACYQLVRVAGAAQKAEIAQAPQLGVACNGGAGRGCHAKAHAKRPCRNQALSCADRRV
ncbi:hypothetical protein D3C72_1756450 [compost metagenome]